MQNAEPKRFCTQCGKPLGPDDKFCSSCGSPAKTAPAAAVTLPASPVNPASPPAVEPARPPVLDETVAGAVLVSRKKGMFSIEGFHLIATSKRLVFAAFTNDMAKEAAKEEGKSGFFSGMIGAMTVGYTYYQRYLTMDPEIALRENPQNFAIPRQNICKIKFEMGAHRRDPQTRRETWDESKLEIETISEKHSFKINHQLHDQAHAVLSKGGLI